MAKILIVDDDVPFAEAIRKWIAVERHEVDVAYNAIEALSYLASGAYDVILLDWHLPDMSGVELLKKYRAGGGFGCVLMLTAMTGTGNKITGLDAGADDYLTKPFDMKEMLARLNALLRRRVNFQGKVIQSGDLLLDSGSRVVTRSGIEIRLKPLEFSVLEFLMQHPRQVITPDTLLKNVWDSPEDASTDAVYTCMNRLRKRLNDSGKDAVIKTIHGVGYRFDP